MTIPIVLIHSFVLANTHQVIVDDVNTGKRTTKFHLRLAERQVQGKLIYFIFCVDAVVGGVLSLSMGGRILRIYTYSSRLLNSSLCIIQNYKSLPLPFSSSTQKNLPLNLSHTLSSSPSSSSSLSSIL